MIHSLKCIKHGTIPSDSTVGLFVSVLNLFVSDSKEAERLFLKNGFQFNFLMNETSESFGPNDLE